MALDQNVPLVSNQIAVDLIAMNANWEQLVADLAAKVSDAVYAAAWDGVTSIAPSKNAVYDKIVLVEATVSALCVSVAGTKMWFYQNIAPTGWTITAGIADVAIAVKGGSAAYNVNGGNIAGTWTQPDCTLSAANLPAHDHGSAGAHTHGYYLSVGIEGDTTVTAQPNVDNTPTTVQTISSGAHTHTSVGSGTAHNHGTAYRPYAAVGIICTKD